ncbi:hypothetical protein BegalDRAFT_3127 [Beggiatoa alba B18LD]|uniref:Gamma-glutamylcyclotransferase AIG2-like domain-containing protein n=1 Tax=Beggiatoa alba B18LD TaxID=395493 RepID=I3CK09_9GAMM|nr:gamma-glutamylcyclotransferase family protein [Beggiatoa alba]EIJ43952.1 hypothetical protein BegalDRAFT_3127 [Beggiatoa alba B18LD]
MKPQEYLFVYGTLLKNMQHAMHQPITRYAEFIDTAHFQGKLYEVNGYPCAIYSPLTSEHVFGELYCLHQAEELFLLLDDYEGCSQRFPTPTEYIRQKMPVFSTTGQGVLAWIYLYNWKIHGLQRIYSGNYLHFTHQQIAV